MIRALRPVALCLLICSLAVVARVTSSGLGEFRQGQDLEAEEQWHEAAVHYGRAVHMYLPLSPLPGRAGERLLALGEAAMVRGEAREARFCFEELRSGFLAVRSTYHPGQHFIDDAERQLTELMRQDSRGNWPDRALSEPERRARIAAALGEREDPDLLWVLVMGLGYFLWLGGAGLAIWRGLPAEDSGEILWPVLLRFGGLSVVGYALWLLGVALA